MMILGTDYYLDQDFTDSDRKSLLKDEDSNILYEYELSPGIKGDEALCELWLRWRWFYKYKPSELTAEQYIKVLLQQVWDMGREYGKKEKATEIINTLQKELED